ncbi:ABC transporter ATP-binding protein [Dermacoccus nishinomiyaensis]|uniref:ABC transporter ATP-binding protein n=1 Tax=Dermacoccus TaxID=57495 RepID=UPI0010ABB843|nr:MULTISPECIES: ABC transporter ATP-binding protein [Dermacoccus]TJZ96229.1 ABC transporter ATP-binding protein [Dermacoccus nishinomiyaensis]
MSQTPPLERPPAVHAADLRVVRNKRAVLQGLSFAVPAGRITGLLGPSGCGKSTLMRAIVGVQDEVSGTLDVLGNPAGHARNRARIGYVTQAASVYDDLTIRENLHFFASVLDAREADIDSALHAVDLHERGDQLVRDLSGGQRSRVSLAVALLRTPDLLVLDEPTVGLDPVLRRDLWHLFADLAADGATLLVSSHVMDEADHCDRLLLMRDGELLADSTPSRLKAETGCESIESAFLEIVR